MCNERIRALLREMTFEEKLGQMTQCGTSIYSDGLEINEEVADIIRKGRVGSFLSVCGAKQLNDIQRIAVEESRLKIPLFFGNDVIHGYTTVFPDPAGEACSFEPEMAYEDFKVIATESRANGTHVTWTPMVDITHDQRWGRYFEGAGEDVFLGCEFAKARVEGLQHGDLRDDDTIAACAKHYVAYGACEGGRDYNTVDMSDNMLYNVYLPPFKAAVESGVEFVMTAFNDLNGVPCSANKRLLRDILRNELGFRGIVISDYNSLCETIPHGYAEDESDAAIKALTAGLDIEMGSTAYQDTLQPTPEIEKLVDEAVYRILDFKFRLGLFENPYVDEEKAKERSATAEFTEKARNAAKRSMVLLENNGVLPIKNKKVALIGRLADSIGDAIGGWICTECEKMWDIAVTIREGLENCDEITEVTYADGYDYPDSKALADNIRAGNFEHITTNDKLIKEAVSASENADVILYVLGETVSLNGEAKSRADISIGKAQLEVLQELKKLGKPIVAIVMAGRPLAIGNIKDKVDALFFTYNLGTEAGNAVADIITGRYNPSAKLSCTLPTVTGQCGTMYYSHTATGRPADVNKGYTSIYIDAPIEPAYVFGYGRSYTDFEYKNLKTDKDQYKLGEKIRLAIDVENIGDLDGEEVVQVYMKDHIASIVRPTRQLIAFKKHEIKAKECKKVEFEIDTDNMGYYSDGKYVREGGKFTLYVGGSSLATLDAEIYLS